jgi:hypothetical protein
VDATPNQRDGRDGLWEIAHVKSRRTAVARFACLSGACRCVAQCWPLAKERRKP